MRYLIGRYHEIALKGRNRGRFVEKVKANLRAAFADFPLGKLRGEGPRLIAELPDEITDPLVIERAARVFGLQNFTISREAPLEITAIRDAVVASVKNLSAGSFRIKTRRDDKRFALNSLEIDRLIGAAVKAATGWDVDLENPEVTVDIEILPRAAYYSVGKRPGAGGLPVGISGRALALLSGGIDSPVAAFRMMGRGLHCDFIHFHSYPLLSRASQDKARELAEQLNRFEYRSRLFMAPFGELQREVVARVLRPLRVVLYRRFMMRIAVEIARRIGASCLVTGESLGQVASQTLENMNVIEQASALPIFRPLVGMDKNEIVEQARRLGTFETSIMADQDCCTLFVPRHPETRARIDQVEAAEALLEVERMVAEVVAATEECEFSYPLAATARRDEHPSGAIQVAAKSG